MNFSEINIGDSATIRHKISEQDIQKFVELSGDDNKLHIDTEFAKNTEFKKPVAHGMIGASFISTIIGTKIPGDGALWLSQTLDFLRPVRVGDTLEVVGKVTKKFERDSIIELETIIYNQYKEIVTRGIAKVKISEKLVSTEEASPSFNHKGSAVIIFGSTGGIGSQAAIDLAKCGYDVILHYNSNIDTAKHLESLINKEGRKCLIVKADVSNSSQIHELKNAIFRFNTNIAGFVFCPTPILTSLNFLETPWSEFIKQYSVNVEGFYNIMQTFAPWLVSQKYGKVVVLTSQATEKIVTKWSHYISAKSALEGLAKSTSLELAPYGVRVNLVSPGFTDTDLVANVSQKSKLQIGANIPLKKIATPTDISKIISFLISDASDYLVGETIRINGGNHIL